MPWNGWSNEMPVQICGVSVDIPDDATVSNVKTTITEDGSGYETFENLACAQAIFPDLDPENSTTRFTWAMRGEVDGEPAIRFETWPAYKMYSA